MSSVSTSQAEHRDSHGTSPSHESDLDLWYAWNWAPQWINPYFERFGKRDAVFLYCTN